MTPLPAVMNSVEKLGYRVTVGDVAAYAGLEINLVQQELLALASAAGGHLQVAETGDILYLFPRNFRGILRNKYWQLRLQKWWQKIWRVLFYLIRISFGIILILSILLLLIAISVFVITISRSGSDENSDAGSNDSGRGGGLIFFPRFLIGPDFWWFFNWDYGYQSRQSRQTSRRSPENKMNFLEAVFSFLFGDGNPNANLEEHRWQEIGKVISSHRCAVVAEQIAPYLDNPEVSTSDNEDYLLPVLTRFNGYPEVSDQGEIIYYFPDLQVTANKQQVEPVAPYLQEKLWRFSAAGSGQIIGAIILGSLNFVLVLVLGYLLNNNSISELGSLLTFVASIYGILLAYAVSFLLIPLGRYFWLQGKNQAIQKRNQKRQNKAIILQNPSQELVDKINYAQQFATRKVIDEQDIIYSTEKDLLEQNVERADQIDEEWRRRLESESD